MSEKIDYSKGIYDARQLGTGRMLILGVQHMFAMFGATVLVPLLTGLSVSTTLLCAGLGTLLFHLVTRGKVPAFLGSSFAYLGGFSIVAPMLADANGNIVNAVNAKATADLGAGEQELDTATVVPENTLVTVTANLPEGAEGAEFLGWSAVRDDGKELDLGDDQTAHFKMPGCNVTVEALYQGGNVDPVNPGGGGSDVVAGIAAVALTGAAVWGIYETGTGIYRVLNMPGVPMPSNRAGLATLIWEKAGCPEPQTVKSFSDIDDADLHLRQAASWMEEQGLMDDVKENEFRPYRYVTKLQTCLVWDKAKEESLIS